VNDADMALENAMPAMSEAFAIEIRAGSSLPFSTQVTRDTIMSL